MSEAVDGGEGYAGIDRGVLPPDEARRWLDWSVLQRAPTIEEIRAIAEDELRRTSCACPACGAVAAARERLAGDRVKVLDAECYFCEWRGVVMR